MGQQHGGTWQQHSVQLSGEAALPLLRCRRDVADVLEELPPVPLLPLPPYVDRQANDRSCGGASHNSVKYIFLNPQFSKSSKGKAGQRQVKDIGELPVALEKFQMNGTLR